MINSRMPTRTRKEKKSFTLSRSSVAFLERLRKKRNAPSASIVLDELVRDADMRDRRESTERAIGEYYDNLSAAEREEEQAWGRFALAQFSEEDK